MEKMVTVNADAYGNEFLQAPVHSHCCRCPVALETTHSQWEVLTCLASFFLHLILPRMFCLVFSRPSFSIHFQPLLTSSALSSFILLPRQNVRLLHLPHCAPPRVLPLCRAPLSPHACLASSHEDQLLWFYRWRAQARHVSKNVPWQTFISSILLHCCSWIVTCLELGRLRRSFIIWW